jgi:hypothetical protein
VEGTVKSLIKSSWALVRKNKRAYLILNLVYNALVIVCMIYAAFNQELQDRLLNETGAAFLTGPLSFVGHAYSTQAIAAILATLFVNLFIGSLASITLPSLIIPFSGILVGAARAIVWGLLLSPAHPGLRLIMIPHSIALVLEGQAYVMTMLAAYIQGRAFLWPRSVGLERRSNGYLEGLKLTGKLYLLIILILAIAAIYEVIEVVIIVRFLP